MSGFLNLPRARDLMKKAGLDGLLICTPENFYYATGFNSMLLDLYRQVPLGLVLITADEKTDPIMIVPDADILSAKKQSGFKDVFGFPIWWEAYPPISANNFRQDFQIEMTRDNHMLPEQFDPEQIYSQIHKILIDCNLDYGKLGLELSFISQNMFYLLQEKNPHTQFLDSTSLLYELRKVKTPHEIEHLRQACKITEAGLISSSGAIHEGIGIGELMHAFNLGVLDAAKNLSLLDGLGEISGQPGLGTWGMPKNTVQHATTIKYDVQVSVFRYHSDVGRSFVFGKPFPEQEAIYQALMNAHKLMKDTLYPGSRICDIYNAARKSLKQYGFSRHSRGHFGHSIGLDPKIEEPPFISAYNQSQLEPGMVLAVETPFYYDGIAKLQFENMVLIKEDGPEIMNELPMEWLLNS